MYWDAITVKPLEDYRLYVEIKDGRKGVFDVKPYLDFGVFKELRDPHYFNRVGISYGAITWPNEQDIAPETLVAELKLEIISPTTSQSIAPNSLRLAESARH